MPRANRVCQTMPFGLRELLGLALLTLAALVRAEVLYFQRINTEQGLPRQTIMSLAQDPSGYIWIGTQGGLLRHDGYDYLMFRQTPTDGSPALSDNWIWSILCDPDGSLWLGTRGGGLNHFNPDGPSNRIYRADATKPDALSHDEVLSLMQDRPGQLWVGTRRGLNRLDTVSGRFQHFPLHPDDPDSLSRDTINALAPAGSGRLWVGSNDGLFLLDPQKGILAHYLPIEDNPTSLPDLAVTRLLVDSHNRLWIGTLSAGLVRYRPEQDDFLRIPLDTTGLTDRDITSLLEDRDGKLWIGTDLGGLRRLAPDTGNIATYQYDAADLHSLSDNRVQSLLQERSGTLWVGTLNNGLNVSDLLGGGIARISESTPGHPGLSSRKIAAIAGDGGPVIWAATAGGGLDRVDLDTGQVKVYRHDPNRPDSLSHDHIRSIWDSGRGWRWLGTRSGLDRMEGDADHFEHYPRPPAQLSDSTVAAVLDEGPIVWIGTENGGLNQLDLDTNQVRVWRHDPKDPGSLSGDYVRQLYRDRKGRLWVGTIGEGLNLMRADGSFRHFNQNTQAPERLSNNRVYYLFEDSENTLWVGTGEGLDRLRLEGSGTDGAAHIQSFGVADGFDSDSIGGIRESSPGVLWLSTSAGLSRFDVRRGKVRNYSQRSGALTGYIVGSVHDLRDGRLLFGGSAGISLLNPSRLHDNQEPPQVRITDVLVLNRSWLHRHDAAGHLVSAALRGDNALSFGYQDAVFGFEFAALHYADPLRNRYAYRLEGFDRDWIETDARRRFATYTNLPAGDYHFEVRASNPDGIWSQQSASVAIHIQPAPWRSPLAYAAYTLALLLMLTRTLWVRQQKLRAERAHRAALEASEERLKLALWGSGDGLWDWQPNTGALHLTGLDFLGFADDELPASLSALLDRIHPQDAPGLSDRLQRQKTGQLKELTAEFRLRDRSGEWRWLQARTRAVANEPGDLEGHRIAGTLKDVQRQKQAEKELRYLASHDVLTGLPNRAAFQKKLRRAMRPTGPGGTGKVALFFLDLDHFKHINDSLGHPFGDRLLQAVTGRLQQALPANAVLARFGGDEFTVLLPVVNADAAAQVAEHLLQAFTTPISLDYYEMAVTPSLGIALYPDDAESDHQLILAADTAMYAAKAEGRHQYRFYTPVMNARLLRRLQLEAGLRKALENREFFLVYQPKLRLADQRFDGAEVLLRWQSPLHGLVSPAEFIPLLEDTGLIGEVGQWLLRTVCHQLLRWHKEGLRPGRLALNISAHQLLGGDFPARVAEILEETGVDPESLEIELTESALMENVERSLEQMLALRGLGLRLAIDDFGTGYSSFAYLKRLPVSTLKIDKVFVHDLVIDGRDAALCRAMIAVARTLSLEVVAEGVETEEQLEQLQELGCDAVQGFLLSKPLPQDEYRRLLRGIPQLEP